MKFRRLLAAILGALMITSCMSFVAGAQEAEAEADIDAAVEAVVEEAEEAAETEEVEVEAEAEEAEAETETEEAPAEEETAEEAVVETEEEAEEVSEETGEEDEAVEAEEAPVEAENEEEETEEALESEEADEEAALADETAETVTITFNRRNGSYKIVKNDQNKDVKVADLITTEVVVGEKITFPTDPSYIYHTFKGWSETVDGTVVDISDIKATADKTYYAVWEWNLATGTPIEYKYANDEPSQMNGEGCSSVTALYDATVNRVYKHFVPAANKNGSCNMYNGIKYSLPGSAIYMVALIRTNRTGGKPSAGIYNSVTKDGNGAGFADMTAYSALTTKDEWVTVYLSSTSLGDLGLGTHIDFAAHGGSAVATVTDQYFDVAGVAMFGTEDEMKNFDLASKVAYNGTAVVSFDTQTADDDSDVTTTYPGTPTRDGYVFKGWASDAAGTTPVDLTKLPVPTADVTYYAVWVEEITTNFHKNDGSETVETVKVAKGDALTAPTFTVDGKTFLGWAASADSTELVTVDATANENKDYYAVWADLWLTSIVVNGNDFNLYTKSGAIYGVDNITTIQELALVMPYGYPTTVIPTIVPTANAGEAVYTAPETFDGEGNITITSGETSKVIPVTFTVADKSTVKDLTTIPADGVNATGKGLYAKTKNTDKGISATKFIPIYSEDSEYYKKNVDANGTVTGGYLPERFVNIEGWAAFDSNGINLESYKQYRALIYYDAGENGKRDITAIPSITTTSYGTRGPLRGKATSLVSGEYKTGRWEYAYFNVAPAGVTDVYGWSMQFSIGLFGSSPANGFTDDVLYVAKIDLLVDADEKYLQYKPTELSATNETSAKNDGTISGVTSDMEVSVNGGEYVAITTFEGFNAEKGVLGGLDGGKYSLRYAGSDTHAASEAAEVEIVPYDVDLTFYKNIDNTTDVFVTKSVLYNATEDIVPLMSDYKNQTITTNNIFAHPARVGYYFKGWAKSPTATEPETVVASANASYYAVWEETTILEKDKDYTVTVVDGTNVTESPVPEGAIAFMVNDANGSFTVDSHGYEITKSGTYPGLTHGTYASYYAKGSQNMVLGDANVDSLWYKYQDGAYVGEAVEKTGVYNVAYRIYASGAGNTRGFWLSAGDVEGTVHLDGLDAITNVGTPDTFVQFRTTIEAGEELKYSAAKDFDDIAIQGAQLLGVYIWPESTVYISDTGSDENDGLSAETPVLTMAKVQSILGTYSVIDTVKVVGTYTYKSNETAGKILGVAGRTITFTGVDSDALFDFNDPAISDEVLGLAGPVVFKNIKMKGSTNDGRIESRGHELTFAEGITRVEGTVALAVGSNSDTTINVLGGYVSRLFPGYFNSGAIYKTVNVNVSGAGTYVDVFSFGHNWHGINDYHGVIYANISDGATVNALKVQANGTGSVANYSGLRYYTVDNATVNTIYTTGRPKQTWDGGSKEAAAENRTGISVFEFNNGAKVTNSIAAGGGADSSTRIVIFNDGTSAKVTDTGAIVIKSTNGKIHADITATVPGNARASAVLNGYSYTTDAANQYLFVNGKNYLLSEFANTDSGEATLSEDVTVLIPATLFEAGKENIAIFAENPVYTVTWKNGDTVVKTEYIEEGSTLTASALTIAPDKNYYEYAVAWTSDVENFDVATHIVSADITINAVVTGVEGKEMPETASRDYSADFGHVQGNGVPPRMFTQKMETVGGINAVKFMPNADSPDDVQIEGHQKYPMNYSTGNYSATVDTDIYEYYAIRYYYEPGTNTEERKININVIGGGDGDVTEVSEPRKWSYAVGKFVAGATTNQFHINAMRSSANADIAASTLAANGEAIYIDNMILFQSQPTVADITFKAENGDTLFVIEAINGEAVIYGGEEVTKTGYTFKGWAKAGTTEVAETLTFTEDTTLVPVFEKDVVEEPFPDTPTYKTYGKYNAASGTYTVELKLSGTKANVGSFGFEFPTEYMTLTNVTANAAAGVALLPEEATEAAQLSPIFVKDTENGYYANTWTAELAEGYGYVDATQNEVLIATFTFTVTAQQRTAFEAVLNTGNYKFDEYVVANADAKYYKDGNYLVAPYVDDLSTNKEAVVYASHKDEVSDVEAVSINLKVNFINDKGGASASNLATVRVDDGEAIAIETAGNTESANYTIENLTAGQTYAIYVEKNGYVAGVCEVTVTAGANTLEMTLIPGDIKGAADAKCGDGEVNLDDFVRLIRAFDPASSDDFKANVDINEDGSVTVSDLGYIKSNYNKSISDVVITFNGEAVTPGIMG